MIAIVKQTIEKKMTNNHRGKINDLNFDVTILINLTYEYESLRSIYRCIQSILKMIMGTIIRLRTSYCKIDDDSTKKKRMTITQSPVRIRSILSLPASAAHTSPGRPLS